MALHRYSAPSYFGGLPAGYDYINDPVTNGDAGVAAFADGKKGSGVNAGTYFVGFGEDATSSDANRPARALAQNTDFLDDLLRRDLAITARTADVTAGSPVSSIVIAGQVYVGDNGVANTQATRDSLVSVLDNNDNEIIVGSSKIQATLIHDGSSNNVVGNQASGFFSTVTVNLNVAIPAGTTYRLYYGARSNLATLPKDAFTSIKIRGAQEVEAAVELLFRDLHSSAAGTNWNDPWTASVNSLARTGLDGRYRLATTDPGATPALNTPGNGGTILRDGPAPAISFPTYDLSAFGTIGTNRYPDPQLAGWRMKRASPLVGTTFDTRLGGDVGLYQESPTHNYVDVAEVAYTHITGALLLDVIPRSVTASTISGHTVSTRISAAAVGSVNAGAGTDAASRRTITLAAGDYIRAPSGAIGFRKNDLLEITDNVTGQVVGTYKLDAVLSDSTFTVKTVTGAVPPIAPSGAAAPARFRWLQPVVSVGGNQRVGTGDFTAMPSLFVAQPGLLTNGPSAENLDISAIFLSALSVRNLGVSSATPYTALAWGGYDTFGGYSLKGALLGDGGISSLGGRATVSQLRRLGTSYALTNGSTSTVSHDPVTHGNSITVGSAAAYTTDTQVNFAISSAGGYAALDGDEINVYFVLRTGSTAKLSVSWDADVHFSGLDGTVSIGNSTASDIIVGFALTYMGNIPTPGWYAKRYDW